MSEQPTLELLGIEPEPTPQRVCVASGASGLGQAIARAFYAAGARVHVGDAAPQALAEMLAEHPGMHGTVVDLTDAVDVESMFVEALSWQGGLDVLVCGASIGGPRAHLWDVDPEEFERTLRVNLGGAFSCVRQAARLMREQRSGSIVVLSSTAARTGLPLRTPYVASLMGLLGLMRNTARELGPHNVRCNALLPGFLDTREGREVVRARAREHRRTLEEAEAEFLGRVSMRAWIDLSEVAEMALFLASDRARHVTGQAIGVCGGVEWEG